jgi:hypothetical protein
MNTMPSANLNTILKHYAIKQNSPLVHFNDFCDYMRRYSQKYLEQQEELIKYVANSHEAVAKELVFLESDKKVAVVNEHTDKKAIVVAGYFIDRFSTRYRELEANPVIPFPTISDFPKYLTKEIYEKKEASEFIFELLDKQILNDENLYAITFARDVPSLILPSSVSIMTVLEIAVAKIRLMLRKEEYHDYFLKKIRISNPGKELSAKNFFSQVVNKPNETEKEVVTIAGKHCESGDILAKDISLPIIEEGDVICFYNTGAYGYSMSSNYNRVLKPAAVLVNNGKSDIIINRQTYEQLCESDVIPNRFI